MLTRIQEQLGLKGFSRVLLDSFSRDDFEQLIEEYGLKGREKDSDERKALGLANLISSWPQLAMEVGRLLDSANGAVAERIQALPDEVLLSRFSPQNAEMDVSPGRLLWALLRCGERPACRELLRIWVDFLAHPVQAPADIPQTHVIDERNVLEAERRAVALFAEDVEQSPQLSDEGPQPQRKRVAEEKVPALGAMAPTVHLDPIIENRDTAEASDRDNPPATPVEEEALTAEPTAARDEPGSSLAGLPAGMEPSGAEAAISPPAVADASYSRTTEALSESVIAVQEALERHLGRLDNRLDQLDHLSLSLKRDIETVKSGEKQLLTLRINQATSMLTAVRKQTREIQSRLEKIPSITRPGVGEPEPQLPVEEERRAGPTSEKEEVESMPQSEEPAAESLAEERPVEPVPVEEAVPLAGVSVQVEEEFGRSPARLVGEEEKKDQAEISEPLDPGPLIEPIFHNETIIIVGAQDHLAGEYQALIEGLGGRFERYPSVDEFSVRSLEDLADRAYLMIVLGNVATQRGVLSLMEVANRLGRRFFVHHSTAPTSLHQFLLGLVEGETI